MTFADYTDAVLAALTFNPRFDDVVARKQEILDGVYRTENLDPTTILFVGFNPAILSCKAKTIAVTEISDVAQAFLKSKNVKFTYIDSADLPKYQKQFQSHKNNNSDISDSKKVAKTSIPALFIESTFEGCLFVFLNIFLLKLKIKNTYARIFILGVILHLVFEFLQLHIYFCKRCV